MLTIDRVAGGALVAIGLVVLWESRRYPLGSLHRPGPSYMPVILALLLIVFGLALAVMGARSGRMSEVSWHEWRHAVAIFSACAFAAWGLDRLGYRLTVAVVMLFLLRVLEGKGIDRLNANAQGTVDRTATQIGDLIDATVLGRSCLRIDRDRPPHGPILPPRRRSRLSHYRC